MYEIWTSIALLVGPGLAALLGWRFGYSVGYSDGELQDAEEIPYRHFQPWPWSK